MEAPVDFFAPSDLSMILAAYKAGGTSRELAFQWADQNCRRSGHKPVETLLLEAVADAVKPKVHAGDTILVSPDYGRLPVARVTALAVDDDGNAFSYIDSDGHPSWAYVDQVVRVLPAEGV